MDCKEAQDLMSAYIDDELDASNVTRYAAHLAVCATCTHAYEQLLNMRTMLKANITSYRTPSHLRHRIQADLNRDKSRRAKISKLPWAWINFGVATACSVAFSFTLALYLTAPSEADRLDQEIIASHYRSLLANHLADIASSDQHTVKPWFSGKLDFSPPVYDLAQQGFPLVGGRLDYVNQRPVAALAYRHRQHLVNLFVWPDKAQRNTALQITSKQGFQLLHWTRAGMAYWTISDMSARELSDFQTILLAQIERDGQQ